MSRIDCGEFAEFGDVGAIVVAMKMMLRNNAESYSFSGAENFRWENAARRYLDMINRVGSNPSGPVAPRRYNVRRGTRQ